MSADNLFEDSAGRLALQADAIGHLAQDAGAFAAAFSAFEARDPDAFRWVLERAKLLPHCELICEWLQVKVCVLRCFEVCGPFVAEERPPTFLQFAEVVARLGEDEEQLRRLVDAVSCGDPDAYREILTKLKLLPFCHLICRWVCSAIWRRFCEVVCIPHFGVLADPVSDLRVAAKAMAELIQEKKAFEAIGKVAEAFDCHRTRVVITETGFHRHCEIICWTFCVWRCHRICRLLCLRPIPILSGPHAVEEARGFALAARQLAGHPRVLFDLVKAVQAGDAKLYGEIVDRFRLAPYCPQLCGWVCSVTCTTFCICICPDPALFPWFTTVGYFGIYSDIDPGTGRTNKSLPFPSLGSGGGPNFAFFGDLQLGGFCPATSPTFSGSPMKYRFQYDDGSGPKPITGALVSPVLAGTRLVNWPQNVGGLAGAALVSIFQDVQIVPQPAPADVAPPTVGSPWFPPSFHYIEVDPDGWVVVDPNAVGGGFQTLLGFHTPSVVAPANPNPLTAGATVPPAKVFGGTDLGIIFQATRTSTMPPGTTPDFTNSLAKIRINNATEANALDFAEFVTGCCTPIDATLTVQFTVDHEEMDAGDWSLGISSCSPSAPGDITPTVSGGTVTLSARGGFGTIVEDTTTWTNCSYTATLTTRPGLTTGLVDRGAWPNSLTFAICSH